ncbi:MAG: hypothetical protein ACK505_09815, partial [Flavobacteriales bacterium]
MGIFRHGCRPARPARSRQAQAPCHDEALTAAYDIPGKTIIAAYIGDRMFREYGPDHCFRDAHSIAENQLTFIPDTPADQIPSPLRDAVEAYDNLSKQWGGLFSVAPRSQGSGTRMN